MAETPRGYNQVDAPVVLEPVRGERSQGRVIGNPRNAAVLGGLEPKTVKKILKNC